MLLVWAFQVIYYQILSNWQQVQKWWRPSNLKNLIKKRILLVFSFGKSQCECWIFYLHPLPLNILPAPSETQISASSWSQRRWMDSVHYFARVTVATLIAPSALSLFNVCIDMCVHSIWSVQSFIFLFNNVPLDGVNAWQMVVCLFVALR